MPGPTSERPIFGSVSEAAGVAGITPWRMRRLAETGAVTTRRLPGQRLEILLADAERVTRESVVPARQSA